MQTVETDGAQAAKSFTADNQTYLFIVNGGSVGRYETKSRLYKISSNGTLTVVCQPLGTLMLVIRIMLFTSYDS